MSEDTIRFVGFGLLEKRVTFCFHTGGIAIIPAWNKDDDINHYRSTLTTDKKIHDPLLISMLKNRGLSNEEHFIYSGSNHYIEVTPHKQKHSYI